MPEICKTDIQMIQRLLKQSSVVIERVTSPDSSSRDIVRRCNKMIKKLNKKFPNDLPDSRKF